MIDAKIKREAGCHEVGGATSLRGKRQYVREHCLGGRGVWPRVAPALIGCPQRAVQHRHPHGISVLSWSARAGASSGRYRDARCLRREGVVMTSASTPHWRSSVPRLVTLLALSGGALAGCESEQEKVVRRLLETRACNGCQLAGARLEGAALPGAQLQQAMLREARLAQANLRGADLTGASLTSTDLRRADLQGARFDGAYLTGAQLQDANLEGADLHSAYALDGADFQGANLRGAQLAGSKFFGPAGLYQRTERTHAYSVPSGGANLQRADLRSADLREAVLSYCNLQGARFQGAQLRDASLEGADLRGADLAQTDLRGVQLENATWVDGTRCGPGSVGRCAPLKP